jgi:hypothetical protein
MRARLLAQRVNKSAILSNKGDYPLFLTAIVGVLWPDSLDVLR